MPTQNHNTLAPASEIPYGGTASEYVQSLVELGIAVEDSQALARSLDTLLGSYDLDPTYLEQNPTAALLLTAMVVPDKSDISSESDSSVRRQVIVDAVLGTRVQLEEEKISVKTKEIASQFINKQLSADLKKVFQGDLFSDIRISQGASAEDIEQKVDVWVLDIATKDTTHLPEVLGLNGEDLQLYSKHQHDLQENGKRFSNLTGLFGGEDSIPPAWTYPGKHGEKSTIMVPALYAEALIATTEKSGADEQSIARNFANARHELVHSLGNLFLDDGSNVIGLSIEERRAEYYSDTNGYQDVKSVVNVVLDLHGANVEDIFPKDGSYTPAVALTRLTRIVGLETMLDLMTAVPESYEFPMQQAGGFDAEYLQVGNSINDALLRILRREKAEHSPAYANAIISTRVDQMVAQLHADNIEAKFAADNFSIQGPTALAVLCIKDLQRRYEDAGNYDWQGAFGDDAWGVEI